MNNTISKPTYRSRFNLADPPAGTELQLKFSDGLQWYLHWLDCPDGEDIVQGWFNTAQKARDYAKQYGWVIKYNG